MKQIWNKVKRKLMWVGIIALLGFSFVLFSYWRTEQVAKSLSYQSVETIPKNRVGLLLGTAKILGNGRLNSYYKYRIEAALALFQAGKIEYILISGDNSRADYSEPEDMQADLIAQGIPANRIYLDYAGFRTLDSVVRAKAIFGVTEMTVISQPFHNKRAIFIAKNKGIKAIGFEARDVTTRYGLKVQIREVFSRVKMMLDLYLLYTEPKFYGDNIKIG